MTVLLINQDQHLTKQNMSLDCLYCEELHWNSDNDNDNNTENDDSSHTFDEDEEETHFFSLLSKEEKTHTSSNNKHALECTHNKVYLMEIRREMLEWMKRACSHHNFSLITLVLAINYFDRFILSVGFHLAINYFDRFILSVGFQRESPWITQLASLASLSLASKFEEIHVPSTLELQVECKYIFAAKDIKRMELSILSTLEWNINAVTPVSYFGHLIRMFKLKKRLHWEISTKWETLILSVILDARYLQYVPSVMATATMMQTLKELGLFETMQHQINLIDTFKLNKDRLEECCKFIQEISTTEKSNKRKCCISGDISPTRVLDIDLSETSEDSESFITICSRVSDDEHVPKKCRTYLSPTVKFP